MATSQPTYWINVGPPPLQVENWPAEKDTPPKVLKLNKKTYVDFGNVARDLALGDLVPPGFEAEFARIGAYVEDCVENLSDADKTVYRGVLDRHITVLRVNGIPWYDMCEDVYSSALPALYATVPDVEKLLRYAFSDKELAPYEDFDGRVRHVPAAMLQKAQRQCNGIDYADGFELYSYQFPLLYIENQLSMFQCCGCYDLGRLLLWQALRGCKWDHTAKHSDYFVNLRAHLARRHTYYVWWGRSRAPGCQGVLPLPIYVDLDLSMPPAELCRKLLDFSEPKTSRVDRERYQTMVETARAIIAANPPDVKYSHVPFE
jgi:hypothetical protein